MTRADDMQQTAIGGMEELRAEVARLTAALEYACNQIDKVQGTCPADLYEWDRRGQCATACNDDMETCWKEYFLEKADEALKTDV